MNKNTVYFANDGILDERAFKVMGMSAKAEEGSIGQFGTGLKYAIAGILRLGGRIAIKTGNKFFTFGTSKTEMRGKEFELITCNGEELSYTTAHGKRWKDWQYFRELFSNALDEGGIGTTDESKAAEFDTVIIVECDEIFEAWEDRDRYFLPESEKPIFENEKIQIFDRFSDAVFVKGVRCGETSSGFTFNCLGDDVELTEDRSISYQFQWRQLVANAMNEITDSGLLDRLIFDLAPYFTYGSRPNDAILDKVEKILMKSPSAEMAEGLRERFVKIRGGLKRKVLEMNAYQKGKLKRVLDFLAKAGFEVTADIKLVESTGDSLYGQAKDGEIHLMAKAFEHGVHDLAQTVLEEHAHLTTGYSDMTRELQQWLFRQVVCQAELATGEYL
jgi:hypothetical protein